MKIIGLFGLILINAGILSAQLVVDGSNFITAGTTLIYQNANPTWMLNQDLTQISGENAVWDIADWQYLDETIENYAALDTFPIVVQLYFNNQIINAANYSTAALPVDAGLIDLPLPLDISNAFSYSRTDETGFYNTGTSFEISGFPLATANDTVEKIYQFPMQYGDSATGTLSYFISVPTLGAYGQHATRNSIVDGEGVLSTPYGTYDVLRVKAIRHITDTLFVDQLGIGQTINRPEQIDYAWISPDVPGPLLKISVIAGAVVSAQLYRDSILVGLKEVADNGFSIYPNPAKDFITIETSRNESNFDLTIYSLQGRAVLSLKTTANRVNIQKLNPGVYFVCIKSDNQPSRVRKLVITE